MAASLGQSFVPLFIDLRMNSGDEAASRLASSWGGLLIVTLGTVSALGMIAAEPLMSWLQPGFDPQQLELTAKLFRVVSWLILTNSMATFLECFISMPSTICAPPLAGLAGIVVSLVWTVVWTPTWGIMAAATAVLAGSLSVILILALLIGLHWTWRITFDEALRRMRDSGCHCWPEQHITILVRWSIATWRPACRRAISHLGYAFRVTLALLCSAHTTFRR